MKARKRAPLRQAAQHFNQIGSLLASPLNATSGILKIGGRRRILSKPGAPPGIEHMADINTRPDPGSIGVRCFDWAGERLEETRYEDVDSFLEAPRPAWSRARWIDVCGAHPYVINRLREAHDIHPLAAEDILNIPQRPKVDLYGAQAYIVTCMLSLQEGHLQDEQISFILQDDTLITIQERPGDVWDSVRQRMEKTTSRFRQYGVGYLLYALIDAIVDNCFPILERYGTLLEDMEIEALEKPTESIQLRIHSIKRELLQLRRTLWPMREMVNRLIQGEEDALLSEEVIPYMRDVYDHVIQVMDILETYREMSSSLHDLYMSAVSNRMNEVMKVLTIMASLFIPVTFLAGVYGMNFEHIPELSWKYAYPTFWGICVSTTVGLLIYFRRKGWC